MSRRTIWVPAHVRRLPERPEAFVTIHEQLSQAHQRDQFNRRFNEQIAEDLARALDLDLSGLRVGGERT